MMGIKLACRRALATGILMILGGYAYAQVNLDSLPPNEMNHRFYRDVFHVKRPGLSINGFDNGGDNSKGYGLKQIIELLYSDNDMDPDVVMERETFQDIVTTARHQIKDPNYGTLDYSIGQVQSNSTILEDLALVALVQYVLHENSVTTPIPGISNLPDTYQTAINNLHDDLLKPITWYVVYGTWVSKASTR